MKRRMFLVVAAVAILAVAFVPASAAPICVPGGEPVCNRIPGGPLAYDQNVWVLAFKYDPAEITARVGTSIHFQNLDEYVHTVTDVDCMDASTLTPCRFNHRLEINGVGYFAKTVRLDPSNFRPGVTYPFVCRVHPEMTGQFVVS